MHSFAGTKSAKRVGPVIVLLSFMALLLALPATSAATIPSSNNVSITLPMGQYVKVTVPSTSNITVLSISGGQYDTSMYSQNGYNLFQFVPTNGSTYSLVLNVTSPSSTSSSQSFVYISKQGNPEDQKVQNITGTGNLLVGLEVTALPPPSSNGSAWDPLFGLLPIRFQMGSLTFAQAVEIIALIGGFFLVLGVFAHSKVFYFGLFVLTIAFAMVAGIVFVFIALVAYFLGFAAVNIAWKLNTTRKYSRGAAPK